MNGKLILALLAALAAVTLAKPATRLDHAVQEAAEAFRQAAVDGIEKAAGGLQGELGAATSLATGIVNGGGKAGGAAAPSGGIFTTIMNIICAPLRALGLMSALPTAGALPGVGGAAGMLGSLPGGAGGAAGLLSKLPAGAAVNVAENALKAVRRKRSPQAAPAAAAPNATAGANSTSHVAGNGTVVGNGTAVNGTSAATPACVLGWGEWIFSLFGLLSNRCNTPAAAASATNGTSMANATAGANSTAGTKPTTANTTADGTPHARRKRSPQATPAVAAAPNATAGANGTSHVGTNGTVVGNGTAGNGTVGAATPACVLGWGEWIFSLFGLLSNRCTTPAVPVLGTASAPSNATSPVGGNSTAHATNGTAPQPPAATGAQPAVPPSGRK